MRRGVETRRLVGGGVLGAIAPPRTRWTPTIERISVDLPLPFGPSKPVTQPRATVSEIKVDICNACHPFYTGKQKFVDTTGRVERFQKKFGGQYFQKEKPKAKPKADN